LDATLVGGLPAGLLARHARCELFEELKRSQELKREAANLSADLSCGRWVISRATYRFYAQESRRWFNPGAELLAQEQERLAVAAGVEVLWEEWQRARQGERPNVGRRTLWSDDRAMTLLWQSTPHRLLGVVAAPALVEGRWLASVAPPAARQNVRAELTDAEGHIVAGQALPAAIRHVTRAPAETQLPWTLRVASVDPGADRAQFTFRRRLLVGGFLLIVLLVGVGSYLVFRAVTHELEVAQLQSDFVAAVSHEFRTPLASLRQLSELLAEGRVANAERQQRYYDGLRRETERLHRLVENLLDFGRMEAGAHEYRFEPLDAGQLVRSVSEEFAEQVREHGWQLEISADSNLPRVRGDREALGRALWNLLDNAVKYSHDPGPVCVEAARDGERLAIRVRDQGFGIPASEQQRIFQKFVRASSAREAGIKGTGLGLTMVRHIVAAHGGEIRLASELGKGSTFTILLPMG
jgi:signal transduction histidine kinase